MPTKNRAASVLQIAATLEAAVAQPEATFGGDYLHEDLFAMAAAYPLTTL